MKKYALLAAGLIGCSALTELIEPTGSAELTESTELTTLTELTVSAEQENINPLNPEVKTHGKVLLFGLDGIRTDALLLAKTPNLDALARNGSYSCRAQGGYYTVSGPSWSNVFTGVWEDKHGVFNNDFVQDNYFQYPPFFTRIDYIAPELNTYSLANWKSINGKINLVVDTAKDYAYDGGRDSKIKNEAKKILALEDPDLLLVYFIDVDKAGHKDGFSPLIPEYLEAIELVDSWVGEILNALDERKDKDDWLIIAVTDHGGLGRGHGGQSLEERTVFYISNKGQGEIIPPPRHVDVAPTVLNYLGIKVDREWGLEGRNLLNSF